jgi:SAM-dependent methyltransferase
MANNNRWLNSRKEGGKSYDARFEDMQKAGVDVHGEANFVMQYRPATVLDAGCGTGRVAIELARRGCKIVGLDIDPAMLARAEEKAPDLDWRTGDLANVQLEQKFDLVVMAGNVMLFVSPNTEEQVVLNMSQHLVPGGILVAGFQLNRGLSLEQYNNFCERAALKPLETFSTWDRNEFQPGGDYVVAVHQKE